MTHFLAGKRAKEIEALAARQGFEYAHSDRSAQQPFILFEQAQGRNDPDNVLRGDMRRHSFTAFDLVYVEDLEAKRRHGAEQPWVPHESPAQLTCVVVDHGSDVPATVLNPRARKRLFHKSLEIDVESQQLGDLFQVWSSVPNMARWLDDERFIEFLANTRGKFGFELNEHGLLCIAADVRSQDILGLVAMGVACVDSLPTGLLKAYHRRDPEDLESEPRPSTGGDGESSNANPDDPGTAAGTNGGATAPPAPEITDLRDVHGSRELLMAGRRSAMPATSGAAAVGEQTLPPPPAPEVWDAWVEAHAGEVAGWASEAAADDAVSDDVPVMEESPDDEPTDWSTMTDEEREAELAGLEAMAEEGLITFEEFEEARQYLGG